MQIYNTLTRKKEEFIPIKEKEALIYVCGPTVYNYIHIGNARPLVVFDTLRRYLRSLGYEVKYVVNFTDVDDKIINKSIEEGKSIYDITDFYIEAFLEDARALNLDEENTIHPRATQYIEQMIDFVKDLVDKGRAYEIDGNVYFDIEKDRDYGKLSRKNIEELQAGARIDVSEEKKNPLDFVLWKKKKLEGEPSWDSPWGKGRPGWHLECSVMSKTLLGDTIDIHAGGEDLEFPHHENEIAQSEALTGKPMANYWMHNAMINVDGAKMSKSKGNFFTLKDIREEYGLNIIRLWLISSHYRKPINFSREIMEQNKNSMARIKNCWESLESALAQVKDGEIREDEKEALNTIDEKRKAFDSYMADDLNTAGAVGELFEAVRFANSNINRENSKGLISHYLDSLGEMMDILGLEISEDEVNDDLTSYVEGLLEERQEARKNKDFQRADQIRDELKEKNIEIMDTKEGTTWRLRD